MVGLRFPQLRNYHLQQHSPEHSRENLFHLSAGRKGMKVSAPWRRNHGPLARSPRGSFQLCRSCGLLSRKGMLRQSSLEEPLQSPLGILTLCGMEKMPIGT